ncbi:MAG: sugar ABC transporter ATP-binding protein [Rhodospirillaceae bacterium]|nr:sugar ABC transporter ATP-binding protein [Rhodospirillaceae bacterium]MYJ72596.1 sugar ABC transporter ATP-binding protein [Rhodospirillaceae bacterium]
MDSPTGDAPSAISANGGSSRDAVSVVDVHKAFGVTKALDGCSFSARLGEIHAIVGGNGCGKSTLAKVMSGVQIPDSGQISMLGHTPRSPIEARRAEIATVFQEVLVADECSVADNLFVGADRLWVKSRPSREKLEIAATLMEELTGVEIDPDIRVGGLPLSIKQWITIGRALLTEPRILILDESSAALDLDSTERLFAKMRELRDRGCAVIIVTHRIAELIRISDRATVMRDGRDVGVLEKGEITEKNLLELMTGERDFAEAHHDREAHRALSDEIVMRGEGLRIWEDGDRFAFDLKRGEILGVAGLDGQGQNEFVRALAGVELALEGLPEARSEAGEFVEVADLEDAEACRIYYVSGDRKHEGIFPNLSIFENLLFPLYRKSTQKVGIIDWNDLASVFSWFVDRLSIKIGHRSNLVTSLSGGNQQKVLIGRSFAMQPNILVLNDPARGVDVRTKRELYDHLRDYASRDNAIIFLSSELEEFIGLCGRVVVFRHGSIFDSFIEDEIDPDRILEAMFGQTEGGGAHRHRHDDGESHSAAEIYEFEASRKQRYPRMQIGRIKIVETEAEAGSAEEHIPAAASGDRVKVVYFDD